MTWYICLINENALIFMLPKKATIKRNLFLFSFPFWEWQKDEESAYINDLSFFLSQVSYLEIIIVYI